MYFSILSIVFAFTDLETIWNNQQRSLVKNILPQFRIVTRQTKKRKETRKHLQFPENLIFDDLFAGSIKSQHCRILNENMLVNVICSVPQIGCLGDVHN